MQLGPLSLSVSLVFSAALRQMPNVSERGRGLLVG